MLAVGLIGLGSVMALDLSSPLWAVFSSLHYLQFPWRFLMLPALGCALLAGLPVALLARRRPRATTLVALACVTALIAGGWQRARPRGLEDVPQAEFEAVAVAARDRLSGTAYEYETIWTEGRPKGQPEAPLIVRNGAVTIAELPAAGVDRRFAVSARGRARLRLNTFYFPGWRVLVNGQEQAIDWSNPSGLIEFSVERGEHLVEARFGPTPPRLLGGALSALGLATVLALIALSGHGKIGAGRALNPSEARAHRHLGELIHSR